MPVLFLGKCLCLISGISESKSGCLANSHEQMCTIACGSGVSLRMSKLARPVILAARCCSSSSTLTAQWRMVGFGLMQRALLCKGQQRPSFPAWQAGWRAAGATRQQAHFPKSACSSELSFTKTVCAVVEGSRHPWCLREAAERLGKDLPTRVRISDMYLGSAGQQAQLCHALRDTARCIARETPTTHSEIPPHSQRDSFLLTGRLLPTHKKIPSHSQGDSFPFTERLLILTRRAFATHSEIPCSA